MPTPARRAIVIGGSMGGLFAALLLRRAGWDTHVFERVAVELSGRGAGIVTHPELIAALAAAGLHPEKNPGFFREERPTPDGGGGVTARHRSPQTPTSGNRLFQ